MKGLVFLVVVAATLGGLAQSCSGPPSVPFFPESADEELATAAPASTTVATSTTTTITPTTIVPTTIVPTTITTISTTTISTTTTSSPHPPGVLIIGDSVLEGLRILQYSFGPNTSYDTAVSRSVLQLTEVLAEHEVPQSLVVHLGTNGWWPGVGQSFSDTFGAMDDRRIVLVNVSAERDYTVLANTELQTVADQHDHISLVDWNSVATPELLRDDRFHPNLEGYDVIARMIAAALELPPEMELVSPTTTPAGSADSAEPALE